MAETKLCSACCSIFSDHSLDRYYPFDELQWEDGCRQASIGLWHAHHLTADDHRKAIIEGCLLCSWIPDPGRDNYRTFFSFDRFYRRSVDNVKEEVCEIFLGLPRVDRHKSLKRDSFRIAVERCGPEEAVLERLAASSRVSPSTGDADTLQLAKGWLDHCLENHQECIPTLHPSWVPTRLLALQNSHATLIDTNVISPSGPYATLSHCWGGMPSFVLKSDNLGMFKQGLAFSKFDPTFRDAMIAGQTLGINYLWIDCYCIIQGTDETSRDDWNRESVLMHKVYTNALLNIGAAHGKDSQAGCFKVHQRKEDVFGKILWKPSSRSTRSLHRLINSSLRLKERNEMGSEVRSFAILDRGWIVQERMLAQRMLYFGNSGIYWDCASTDIKSEQWPGGKGLGNNPLSLAPGRLNGRKELRRGKRYGTWLSAIDWYSRCQLSFPEKDKLVAFEGVGRRVCELTGVEYRDGFPQESLPFSLCWSSTGLDGCRNLSAPSWHWAAARHVQWFDSNLDYEDADSNDNKYRSLVAMLSGPHSFLPEDTRSTQVCIGRPVWMPFVRTIEKSFSALLDDTVYSAEQLVPTRREHNLLIPKKRRHSKVCLIPDDIVEFNDILDHTQIFLLPIWWRCNWNMQLQDPQYYRDTMAFSVTNPAFKKHERRDAVSIESRTLQNFQAMHHGQAERFPHFCGMRYGGIVLKCSGMDVYQRVGMFETNYEEGEGLNSGIRAVYQAMSRSKARLITIV